MKNRIFDLSYLRNPLTQELEFFLWCRVHLKMYQKKFQVSTTSGTWFGTTLEIAILAISFVLYIIQAGKSENVKFIVVLICHFYHVFELFRMLLVGRTSNQGHSVFWETGWRLASRLIEIDAFTHPFYVASIGQTIDS